MTAADDLIECCPNPECESQRFIGRIGTGMHTPRKIVDPERRYRCRECDTTFDEPALREPGSGGGLSGLAGQLYHDTDPDVSIS